MSYQSCKVLLVEDVMMIAKITEQMLKKSPSYKYTSVHKTLLSDALAVLKSDEFDIILLDLNLPDSIELATLSAVVEAAPDVPIIVLTASSGDGIGVRAVKLGAQDFLNKGDFNYLTLDRAIVYACERHRLQRTIRQLAVVDELSGLYNRRGYNTLNPDILAKVKDSDRPGFLCYFDLDRFKQINDELGHAKGDEAIREFASILRRVFRKDVLLVRLGGDEFVAMGIETAAGQAREVLRELERMLSERNAQGDSGFQLESSAGFVTFDRHSTLTLDQLGAAADAALYENKESRRRKRAPARSDLSVKENRT